jgi:multidrug efflux pump subunit AcrA (membrane-fusion protein)
MAGIVIALAVAVDFWSQFAWARQEARVVRRDMIQQKAFRGTLNAAPGAHATVTLPLPTQVTRVLVQPGDRVWKGDVLATVAGDPYTFAQASLKAAEADLSAARGRADLLRQTAARRLEAAREREIGIRDSGHSAVNASLGARRVSLSRAVAEREAAQRDLRDTLSGLDAYLAPCRHRVQEARDALARGADGHIRTPIDGRVMSVAVAPGPAAQGAVLATIVNVWSLQVYVPLDSGERVAPGQSAFISFAEAEDQIVRGKVHSVTLDWSQEGRSDRRVAVLDVAQLPDSVARGSEAEVAITLAESPNALTLPRHAVRRDADGQAVVAVYRGYRWRTVPIRLGLHDEDLVEVSGLREGEIVELVSTL